MIIFFLISSESILEVSISLSQPSTPTCHYPAPDQKFTLFGEIFYRGCNPGAKAAAAGNSLVVAMGVGVGVRDMTGLAALNAGL